MIISLKGFIACAPSHFQVNNRSLLFLITITLSISMRGFAAHYPDVILTLSVDIISSVWLYTSGPRLFTKLSKIAASSCIVITFQHMKEQHYSQGKLIKLVNICKFNGDRGFLHNVFYIVSNITKKYDLVQIV